MIITKDYYKGILNKGKNKRQSKQTAQNKRKKKDIFVLIV